MRENNDFLESIANGWLMGDLLYDSNPSTTWESVVKMRKSLQEYETIRMKRIKKEQITLFKTYLKKTKNTLRN